MAADIDRLPVELLEKIARILARSGEYDETPTNNQALRPFIEVCKRWCAVGRNVVEHVSLEDEGSLTHAANVIDWFPKASSFLLSEEEGCQAKEFNEVVSALLRCPLQVKKFEAWVDCEESDEVQLEISPKMGALMEMTHFSLNTSIEKTLPDVVGSWVSLEEVSLESCYGLTHLPVAVKGWERLKRIKIIAYNEFRLPCEVGSWKLLEEANLSYSRALEELPEEVALWAHLQTLSLDDCKKFKGLPSCVSAWRQLRRLDMSGCVLIERPHKALGVQAVGCAAERGPFVTASAFSASQKSAKYGLA
jgi:hypothetical protein